MCTSLPDVRERLPRYRRVLVRPTHRLPMPCAIVLRHFSQVVLSLAIGVGGTSGCASSRAPTTRASPSPLPTPAQPPLPVGKMPTPAGVPHAQPPVSHPFVYAAGVYRYEIQDQAVVTSPGNIRIDSVFSRAVVTLRLGQVDSSRIMVEGVVDTFTVTHARMASGVPPLLGVPFTLNIFSDGRVLDLASPDSNVVCTASTNLIGTVARELLALIPVALSPAVQWTDSTTSITCPGAVPVIAQTVRRSVASWALVSAPWSRRNNDAGFEVSSTTRTVLSGHGRVAGRLVDLHGEGQGSRLLYVDSELGVLLGGTGSSTTTMVIDAGSQRQEFVQALSRRITLLR